MHDQLRRPQPAAGDLLQLPRPEFLRTVSEGLPLIMENVANLRRESDEIAQHGNRRAVGILQAIAEEEAAKALMLFDAVRCPENRRHDFERLIPQFYQHLAKGIYAYYYNARPADVGETRRIIQGERQLFYREGEYGEYVMRNWILHYREAQLYVDYVRREDGSHIWQTPYPPDVLGGDVVPSGIIHLAEALNMVNVFSEAGLEVASRFWGAIPIHDDGGEHNEQEEEVPNPPWLELRAHNLRMLEELQNAGIPLVEEHQGAMQTIVNELLYPLYPFDLERIDNFNDLLPADDPDWC